MHISTTGKTDEAHRTSGALGKLSGGGASLALRTSARASVILAS
jgi:hypothetical protein